MDKNTHDDHSHGHGHDHDLGHDHGHSHNHRHSHGKKGGHGHSHAHVPTGGSAFAIGIGLNVVFVVAEVIYGIVSNSMALVADAAHNMGDVFGLALAWVALILSKKKPSEKRTYGFRRSTILATLSNAVLLLVAVGGVIWEALSRLHNPDPINGPMVMAVAAVGVLVNGVSALFFFRGKDHDANVRGAFLHLAADAAVSLGVVVAGFVIIKTGWLIVDPLISILVSLVILVSTWSLFKDALNLSLDAVPDHIDIAKVKTYLMALKGVDGVHDLHVWAMSTTEVALTAHLAMPWCPEPPDFLGTLGSELNKRFGISHSTVQIEPSDLALGCALASDDSV